MFAEYLTKCLYHMVCAQSISHGKIFKNILAIPILNLLLWGISKGYEQCWGGVVNGGVVKVLQTSGGCLT